MVNDLEQIVTSTIRSFTSDVTRGRRQQIIKVKEREIEKCHLLAIQSALLNAKQSPSALNQHVRDSCC